MKETFLFFTYLEFFLACSSFSYLVIGCPNVAPIFTSNNITPCFYLQIYYESSSCRFYYKDCKHHYKVGLLEVGQVLQIGASVTKGDNFYLERGGNNCKVMQSRRQMREMEQEGNRFRQLTHSP